VSEQSSASEQGAAATSAAVTYASYLEVPGLLGLQHPRSRQADGLPEHDELLFITIHQVYELWFKQILHELRGDESRPGEGGVQGALADDDAYAAMSLLGRVLTILKTLVAQVDVLETMTPLQFNSFRARLESASGFQSGQFRELEAVLGRRDPRLLTTAVPGDPIWDRVRAAVQRPSVWGSYLRFLAGRGHAVPQSVLDQDPFLPYEPDEGVRHALVTVYRGDDAAALIAERLVDLDEGLQEWRYRHVKMVERTIGHKQGTGGSSGAAYLASTLFTPLFPDLWDVRAQF
jgi:tryptophan 2,3-dioxygenase